MLSILFVSILLSLAGLYWVLTMVVRMAYRAPRRVEQGEPADYGLPCHTVSLTSVNNKKLFAWYIPQVSRKAPAVIIMHGWGGNAEMMLPIAEPLHHAGFVVLLIDARNHGKSDSDAFSSMPRFAEDMETGLDWLKQQPEVDSHQIALLGHSVGAAAALLLASRRSDVAAVVSIAAFAHPVTMMQRHMQAHHIPYRPIGWAVLAYIEHTIGYSFDEIAPVSTVRRIHCPILLVHGDRDRSVPYEDAEAIHANGTGGRVECLILEGADHDSIGHIESHGMALIVFLQGAMR